MTTGLQQDTGIGLWQGDKTRMDVWQTLHLLICASVWTEVLQANVVPDLIVDQPT